MGYCLLRTYLSIMHRTRYSFDSFLYYVFMNSLTRYCVLCMTSLFQGLKLFSGPIFEGASSKQRYESVVTFSFLIFPCLILFAVCHSIPSNYFRFLLLPSCIVVLLFKIAINPSGGLVVQNGYLLINNIIALAGYYVCAMIIDYPKIGRKNVQTLFFTLVSIVFLIMSFLFESLSSELLIFLYFLSSFLGQFVVSSTCSSILLRNRNFLQTHTLLRYVFPFLFQYLLLEYDHIRGE